jgi:hypothetical protein
MIETSTNGVNLERNDITIAAGTDRDGNPSSEALSRMEQRHPKPAWLSESLHQERQKPRWSGGERNIPFLVTLPVMVLVSLALWACIWLALRAL